ncbi:MAG: glycosyltransferase [Candidatus Saccharibacteria bacterium]|nr:glycosyltransferase [Candidatus Saccharibacteria bacterium]
MSTSENLLSIIIPVYNASEYIDHFMTKLTKTKSEKTEIIIIENGSDDDSLKKLQPYANQATIIHFNENLGVSYARNEGLKKSSGTFFTFLDVDDDFEPKILDKMLKAIQDTDSDLCVANYNEVNESTGQTVASKYNYSVFADKDTLRLFLTDRIGPAVWDKIYRRSTLGNIKFDQTLTVGEDILYILNVFLKKPKTVFLNDVYYHYIQHENSIMHTLNPHLLEFLSVPKKITTTQKIILDNYPAEWHFFKLEMYTRAIHSLSSGYKTDRKAAKSHLKKVYNRATLSKIIKNTYFPSTIKLEMFILKTFGIEFHLFLMPLYNITRKISRHS